MAEKKRKVIASIFENHIDIEVESSVRGGFSIPIKTEQIFFYRWIWFVDFLKALEKLCNLLDIDLVKKEK